MHDQGPRVAAIIQARMGSARLPGKVLLPLGGKPVLWHVVQRLRQARTVNTVTIATSTLSQDDAIAQAATAWDIPCYRGSEQDVLDRYYQAAKEAGAEVIVRLPADKPLLDPQVVDEVVTEHVRMHVDYTSNMSASFPKDMIIPFGLEVETVSFSSLERAWREAKAPSEREHVLPYIYQHPNIFKIHRVLKPIKPFTPLPRLCLDTPEDYRVLRQIYDALWTEGQPPLNISAVFSYLRQHPDVVALDQGVQQRGVQ